MSTQISLNTYQKVSKASCLDRLYVQTGTVCREEDLELFVLVVLWVIVLALDRLPVVCLFADILGILNVEVRSVMHSIRLSTECSCTG